MSDPISDDDLVSEVSDLIEEVGVGDETQEYANTVEEYLDEHGELTPEQRTKMMVILTDLRAREAEGESALDDEDEDDLEDDDLDLDDDDFEDDDDVELEDDE